MMYLEGNKKRLSEMKAGEWVFSTIEKTTFKTEKVNIDFIKKNLDLANEIFIVCSEPIK